MTASTRVDDDPTIDNKEVLLRRVYDSGDTTFVRVDQLTLKRSPTSASFRLQDGEDGLSLYLESVLAAADLAATAVASAPMNAVAALPARAIRAAGLGLVRDPFPDDVPDPDHPRHSAHALAVGWAPGRKARHRISQRLATAATLVVDPGAVIGTHG